MERNLNGIIGYGLLERDGIIGEVVEFYFDDETWAVRYLIINTVGWLANRKVLISPVAVMAKDWQNQTIPVNLTSEQIRHSPKINTDKPVSRRQEIALHKHYSWGEYRANWVYVGVDYGRSAVPVEMEKNIAVQTDFENQSGFDPHLRSTSGVSGYRIHANDGEIGHLCDFIFDDQTWLIAYLVVDTDNWIFGKKVLIAVNYIDKVDWSKSEVFVDLSIKEIKDCREFEDTEYIQR